MSSRIIVALAAAALLASACSDRGSEQTPEELATEGFLFGYPLVVTERTLQTFGGLIGVNQPFTQQARSDSSSRVVVAPNTDTLYAIAVLDLRPGPLLLELPDIPDRYHTFQFLDAYTESFAYLGTRTTDGRGGTWLLTPPGWQGDVPAGATRIDIPTPQAFMLGRVLVYDDADVPNVTALTSQVKLTPLDPAAPPPPPLGTPPGPPAETGTNDLGFWDELCSALAINPPTTDAQRALVERLAALGVGPGRRPSTEVTDPAILAALRAGIARGFARIESAAAGNDTINGWSMRTDLGVYGDDLERRATVARYGWGANVPEEAIYPNAFEDSAGAPLDGTHRYRVRFAPDGLPPVHAFWSLTLYDADRFLYDNPQRRYAISDRSPDLVYGEDGSLEIYVQAEPPPGLEANWLPPPPGPFSLMLRLYLPADEVTSGAWQPPTIERLD
ncbi:MAG TPA: DUF1254 domain-containing protein [Candidatus Binatia bacterium]